MNDEQSPQELSEEQEARIRALLAAAKHDEPMPEAVVARLDRVLAGLAEEGPPPADVVHLDHRRRRAAQLLVAAAAVVVAGVGLGQVIDRPHASGDSASAGADQEPQDAPEKNGFGSSGSDGGGAVAGLPDPSSADGDASAFKVRPKHFARDTRSVAADAPMMDNLSSRVQPCSPGPWGPGRYVPVDYGRAPGYLVLRKPRGDSQVADLFLCQGDQPIRSITLPGP